MAGRIVRYPPVLASTSAIPPIGGFWHRQIQELLLKANEVYWAQQVEIQATSRKLVTLVNVFTVEPENQQQLLELLARATETSVRHAPGFISSSLHRGLDGTKVTMYAQWRSVEEYQAMREDPAPLPYLQQALAIARFEPGMYEVIEIFSGNS
jgi:quinol monooxygenase YgiN